MKVNKDNTKKLTEAIKPFAAFSEGLRQFILDVLTACGLRPTQVDSRKLPTEWQAQRAKNAFKTISDEIQYGYCDFESVDDAVETILNLTPAVPKTAKTTYVEAEQQGANRIRVTPNQFMEALISALVTACNWYVEDRVPEQQARQDHIDKVKVNTLFGQMIGKLRRYGSQVDEDENRAANKAARAASQGTTTPRTPRAATNTSGQTVSGARKDDYKYLGPLSSQVRDLKGNPGDKTQLSGYIFFITGRNTNSARVKPYAFVQNLIPLPNGTVKGNVGNTNKVYYGSANGYRQYPVYFADPQSADTFLVELLDKITLPSNMETPHVAANRVDPNGYFKVGTEFGDVFIRASELNEALAQNETTEPIVETKQQEAVDPAALRADFKEKVIERLNNTPTIPDSLLANYFD